MLEKLNPVPPTASVLQYHLYAPHKLGELFARNPNCMQLLVYKYGTGDRDL